MAKRAASRAFPVAGVSRRLRLGPRSMPLGLMFGRPGPPFSRATSSRSAATTPSPNSEASASGRIPTAIIPSYGTEVSRRAVGRAQWASCALECPNGSQQDCFHHLSNPAETPGNRVLRRVRTRMMHLTLIFLWFNSRRVSSKGRDVQFP
jgi:hypothetical protein